MDGRVASASAVPVRVKEKERKGVSSLCLSFSFKSQISVRRIHEVSISPPLSPPRLLRLAHPETRSLVCSSSGWMDPPALYRSADTAHRP